VMIGALMIGETLPPQTGIGGLLIIARIGLTVFRKRVSSAKTLSGPDSE